MQPPKFGYCPSPDVTNVKELPSVAIADAEGLLKTVHIDFASLLGELKDQYATLQWLGNVDAKISGALLEAKKGRKSHAAPARHGESPWALADQAGGASR